MRFVLAAAGSRGDAVPYAALAKRLVARGHDVTVVTHASLASLVPAGIEVLPAPSDPGQLISGPAGQALRRGNLAALNRSRHVFADFLTAFVGPTRTALTNADVLVASTFATPAVDEALRRDVPVVRGHLWPEFDSLDGPMPLVPYAWRLPAPIRHGTRAALRRVEPFFAGVDGEWSGGTLDLRAHHPAGLTTSTLGSLHAYSPLVEPGPVTAPDAHVTGWWRPQDESEDVSPHIRDLLANGDRWVFVGFGSMQQNAPHRIVDAVSGACRALGVRALLQLDGAPQDPTGTVATVGAEPHDALFPLVDAVVHHGGSGTTGTALTAGVPSVVVPHFADQYHWAHRLDEAGVSPAPLPRRLLTARLLASRLDTALSPTMTIRAARLGRTVAAEDGTGRAVDVLEQLFTGTRA